MTDEFYIVNGAFQKWLQSAAENTNLFNINEPLQKYLFSKSWNESFLLLFNVTFALVSLLLDLLLFCHYCCGWYCGHSITMSKMGVGTYTYKICQTKKVFNRKRTSAQGSMVIHHTSYILQGYWNNLQLIPFNMTVGWKYSDVFIQQTIKNVAMSYYHNIFSNTWLGSASDEKLDHRGKKIQTLGQNMDSVLSIFDFLLM